MRNKTPELSFIVFVLLVSLTGFYGLYFGENAHANGFHHLHVASSFLWLILIGVQLLLIDKNNRSLHKRLGISIFVIGPFIVATLAMLTVYSAGRAANARIEDTLVVQNVTVASEVAFMILMAFFYRKNSNLHGVFIICSAFFFMAIALFFSLLTFVPAFQITGPESFDNFGKAALTATLIATAVGVLMFLNNRKYGWPWLVAVALLYLNGLMTSWATAGGHLQLLTDLTGSYPLAGTFIVTFVAYTMLLVLVWRRKGYGRRIPAK